VWAGPIQKVRPEVGRIESLGGGGANCRVGEWVRGRPFFHSCCSSGRLLVPMFVLDIRCLARNFSGIQSPVDSVVGARDSKHASIASMASSKVV